VILSIVDVSLSYGIEIESIRQGKGAISAFRAFRLLRVFKLAKSWSKLKQLLQTIVNSLRDISSFSVLLFLLMFIYILLGMEIFAMRRTKIEDGNMVNVPETNTFRNNFNTFFNGLIIVFTVLTGENWDDTMFQFARKHGYIAIFFFISLIVIGVMIFLNLFLAILLENFQIDEEEEVDSYL
jgi:Ion transport protein